MKRPMEACYKSFGALVKNNREKMGLSQIELGKTFGLTRVSISNIENGQQRVLLHTALMLMAYLKIKPHEIVVLPRVEFNWDNV